MDTVDVCETGLAGWLRSPRWLVAGVLVCSGLCLAVLHIDRSISNAARGIEVPGDVRKVIQLSEVFGHGSGAAAILATVFWLAIDRRPAVTGAILLTLSAGLTANLLKAAVPRARPHSVEALQLQTEAVMSGRREPLLFWDSRQRSFPSGHAATAWGLALGLGIAFPRGAWLFVVFAGLASFQRMYSGAHYLSDVLAGAAIAFAWGVIWLSMAGQNRRVAALFARSARPASR